MDGMLSQDEINALLSGMSTDSDDGGGVEEPSESAAAELSGEDAFSLADSEKDAVGEISNISMGTAATTLSSLLNQTVNITTPKVDVCSWDDLSHKYDRPCVMMQISYKEGLDGNNVLVLKENDVKIITDLMMGGAGVANDDEPLSELHLSAIGEAMNQMMGSAATSLSSMFNRKIDISPPVSNLVETYNDVDENLPKFLSKPFVMVAFKMQIGDLIDSEIMQLYPKEFAEELLEMFMPKEEEAPAPAPEPTPAPAATTPPPQAAPDPNAMNAGMGMQGMPMQGMPMYGYAQPDVNVAPASFQPFSQDLGQLTAQENIGLIMDVPLEVTVELGRTSKSIKDILDFAPGTIIELNKIAGEPVDILVNGKYVAKGEVVVIEESFGVRITEIIK